MRELKLQKLLHPMVWYLGVVFLFWLVISVSYIASSTEITNSPLYNSPGEEIKAVFVYIPIISAVLGLLLFIRKVAHRRPFFPVDLTGLFGK